MDELNINDIAKHACLSSSYFQKIFNILSDVSVGDYIKMRRLSLASQELVNNKAIKVTDVAFKYSYETIESFSRAFKNFRNCLPSEAKKQAMHLSYYPRKEIIVLIKGGKTMDYQIEEDIEYTIIVKTSQVASENANSTCPTLWDDFLKKGYDKDVPPMLAVCIPNKKDDGTFTYGIGSIKECVTKIPEGFQTIKISKQTYIKFNGQGKQPEVIQNLWKEIFTEWLPNSKYEIIEAPEFECYSKGNIKSPHYKFAIWLPIKLKKNITTI